MLAFLIGIGRENARFLRSVEWRCHTGLCDIHMGIINEFTFQTTSEVQQLKEANIWNNEEEFMKILTAVMCPQPVSRSNIARLLRLDADDVSASDGYCRFTFDINCYEDKATKRHCQATYELRTR